MKLQKLLYYIYVWSLVSGKQLFPDYEDFYAWKFGPVNPELYHNFKNFGSNKISDTPNVDYIDHEEKQLIDFILESYIPYNAITLSKTTHSEEPWKKSYNDFQGKIEDSEILEYYSEESFANNFPIGSSDKYYPPKTNSYYAFIFDMDENDGATENSFSSIDEYKESFKKASSVFKQMS